MSLALYMKFCDYWGMFKFTADPTPPHHWDIAIAHNQFMHMPEAIRDEIRSLSGFKVINDRRMILQKIYCP